MITALQVRNFQSLRKVDLRLGRFTVIVGQSSSGKTALVRAIRGLASNVRGSSQLTRGQTVAAIGAHIATEDGPRLVTLEHKSGAWQYRVASPGDEALYSKLNGQVPAEVTALLGVDPVTPGSASLHLAGQFDPPYLLSASGADVARTLGALTNVDMIFAAVREGNRRRAALAADLRATTATLDGLTADLARFKGLSARLEALQRAEQLAGEAEAAKTRVDRLTALVDAHAVAMTALAQLPALVALPTADALDAAYVRAGTLAALLTDLESAQEEAGQFLAQTRIAADLEQDLSRELHQVLADIGECPTCGQKVTA